MGLLAAVLFSLALESPTSEKEKRIKTKVRGAFSADTSGFQSRIWPVAEAIFW